MKKPAETQYPLHEFPRERWSPRAFSQKRPSDEMIGSLLEAARWAPSCFNEQPWRFILATNDDPTEFERLANCLVPANRVWAAKAPVLLLSVAASNFGRNGKPNRHAGHDVGLAVGNLVTQAASMGLYVHQMAGFDMGLARETYQIPEDYEPMAAMAIGFPGSVDDLPEDLREKEAAPRQRKSLADLVFSGSWGNTATIAKCEK